MRSIAAISRTLDGKIETSLFTMEKEKVMVVSHKLMQPSSNLKKASKKKKELRYSTRRKGVLKPFDFDSQPSPKSKQFSKMTH